ncbi:uncharacterized protein MEPE_05813 [Melanopsichium pennsylvanicum]|uniref:Uncharacterized protein n=2 Tax=Melanopsichium pennsylvanicum TaxID=63383 RepID=A0AAJ5C811_9BASI|nr:uncharacterized protein BN887_03053 [Melanopsichium pennsylvanicum 4]SNX87103.1 uncharacterized protein MEPE_05813 [Melanopsichium pennsylvanicum]
MSTPSGRSATVTSLSGRVNALKFMQRASPSSPSSSPSKPTASTSATCTLASPSPAAASPALASSTFGGEASEENWSLSTAAIAKLRAKATGQLQTNKQVKQGPTISQEAGFDAWLIGREDLENSSSATKQSSRQTFGKLDKRRDDVPEGQEQEESRKPSIKIDNDDKEKGEQATLEPDFESDTEKPRKTDFVKPGSIKNDSASHKRLRQDASSSATKKAKKGRHSKDHDKVVFARKRGGKLGISGGR